MLSVISRVRSSRVRLLKLRCGLMVGNCAVRVSVSLAVIMVLILEMVIMVFISLWLVFGVVLVVVGMFFMFIRS